MLVKGHDVRLLSRLTRYGVLAACTCRLFITIDPDTDTFAWSATLRLAERCGLTLYDAAYLELAQRLELPLATLDQELRAAGTKLGVTLLGS